MFGKMINSKPRDNFIAQPYGTVRRLTSRFGQSKIVVAALPPSCLVARVAESKWFETHAPLKLWLRKNSTIWNTLRTRTCPYYPLEVPLERLAEVLLHPQLPEGLPPLNARPLVAEFAAKEREKLDKQSQFRDREEKDKVSLVREKASSARN